MSKIGLKMCYIKYIKYWHHYTDIKVSDYQILTSTFAVLNYILSIIDIIICSIKVSGVRYWHPARWPPVHCLPMTLNIEDSCRGWQWMILLSEKALSTQGKVFRGMNASFGKGKSATPSRVCKDKAYEWPQKRNFLKWNFQSSHHIKVLPFLLIWIECQIWTIHS